MVMVPSAFTHNPDFVAVVTIQKEKRNRRREVKIKNNFFASE